MDEYTVFECTKNKLDWRGAHGSGEWADGAAADVFPAKFSDTRLVFAADRYSFRFLTFGHGRT
ncbi:hypothetical protein ACE41H_03855 [Paenibacillus enshidis]|uniref:Uncharacterized protein n=1 Tax=Paenibacillus enshidis TaxID=1458439 RepID=A0ABV5AP02_9BACL